MNHLSENRLIGYTTAQIKEMQQKAKTPTPIVAPKAPVKVVTAPLSTAKPVVSSSGIDPNRGTRGTAAVPSGVVTLKSAQQFGATLADQQATLQKKAQDEYTANGSVTPETQAYIDRLNPDNAAYFNQTATPDAQSERDAQLAGATDLSVSKAVAPRYDSITGKLLVKAPTSTATSRSAVQPYGTADLQNAVEKRRNVRLAENGVPESAFKEIDTIMKAGGKVTEEVNGIPVFTMPDGTKRKVEGLNESTTKAAINIAGQDFSSEIQGEQDASIIAQKEKARATKTALDKAGKEKFIAGMDTSPIDQTKAQLEGLMSSIKGLDPSLQEAILPQLIQLQQSNNEVTKMVNDMIASYPTDEELEAGAASQEAYVKESSAKYEALLAKNNQTSLEIAKYNNDALKIEKQIIDHDAAVAEQKQMAANVDNEKKLRRQLNRLGIQTDVSGLTFLQSEIQKGADALNNLKTGNNLVSLKAQLAIGEGYRLEVKQAMETYEGNYLNILTQTQDKISGIKNSMSIAKADRTKGIIDAKKWGIEQKQENDKEARTMISAAQKAMADAAAQIAKDSKSNSMSTKDKLGFVSGLRTGINQNKTITQANDADGFYGAMTAAYDYYQQQLTDPALSEESRNAAQSAVVGSFARMLDPGSVVRNEEYERQVYGQAFVNTARGLWDKATKGGAGLTPADIDAMRNTAEKIHDSWETRLSENMQPFILDINDWNANYPEAQILYAQVIPVDRVYLPSQTMKTWGSQANGVSTSSDTTIGGDWLSNVGTGQTINGSKAHKGKDAYAIDIDGRTGNMIPANAGGRVISVDDVGNGGYGKNVVIEDSMGYRHMYAHMDSVNVKNDQVVQANFNIGIMGNTGNTMDINGNPPPAGNKEIGSHLHYAITKNGSPISLSDYQKFAGIDTKNATKYSLIPTAEASGPDDTIYIEPEEVTYQPPAIEMPSQTIGLGGLKMNPEAVTSKILGTFRDVKTGEIIRPTNPSMVAYYKSKPYGYKDLEAPETATQPSKPLVLTGDPTLK